MRAHDLAIAGRIRPSRTLVLIQVLEHEKKTAGGLHIPDTANGRHNTARVLRVGSEVPPVAQGGVGEGDVVMFNPLRLRLVLAEGALAQAQGTPGAFPGQCALIDQEDLVLVMSKGTRVSR